MTTTIPTRKRPSTKRPASTAPPKGSKSTGSTKASSRGDRTYDAIVIGGGHNGLVNGAYLAKAGLKTLIIERRHLVGGAAITEELRPGFWFTTFSYALSLLRPDIIHDLELTKHGFMPLLMSTTSAPGENGDYLLFTQDHSQNLKEIARHSKHDADAYDQYTHDIEMVCQAIKPLLDMVPPDIFSDDPEELMALAGLGSRFRKLDKRVLHNAVRLLTGSAADFLDDYFDSELLKGYLASSSIIGTKVGPRSQGSGLVLLYHSIGEHDGEFGSWAFHKKGNGGFTQVLARAAQSLRRRDHPGVTGRQRHHEERPDDRRRASGRHGVLRRHRGQRARSRGAPSSSSSTRASCRTTSSRTSSGSGSRGPRRRSTSPSTGCLKFPPLGQKPDHFRGFTNIGPSMDYLERAFDDAKYGWYSQNPYIDMAIQSTIDADMAPPGKHVLQLLHPVHAVPAARERLGHREGEPGRHRPAHAGAVLPGLRRPRAAAARSARRSTSSGRSGCPRATSSPASSSRRRCSSSGRRRAGASTALRSTATTSAAPARTRAAASWARPASSPPARSSRTGQRPARSPVHGSSETRPPDTAMSSGRRSGVVRVGYWPMSAPALSTTYHFVPRPWPLVSPAAESPAK